MDTETSPEYSGKPESIQSLILGTDWSGLAKPPSPKLPKEIEKLMTACDRRPMGYVIILIDPKKKESYVKTNLVPNKILLHEIIERATL